MPSAFIRNRKQLWRSILIKMDRDEAQVCEFSERRRENKKTAGPLDLWPGRKSSQVAGHPKTQVSEGTTEANKQN